MATKIKNTAECQAYLHSLICHVDMHNMQNPNNPQVPNWVKVAEHINDYRDRVDWKKFFEDPHFSPRIKDSLMVRGKDDKFIFPYALDYGKYKMDLRSDIVNNNIDFKAVEKALKNFNTADWELVAHKSRLFNDLVESGHISEDSLEKMTKYFTEEHWNMAASNQDLSASFIERHIEEIPESAWSNISMYQDMDESFMQKYLDAGKLDGKMLSVGQNLSMDFIEKNLDKLDMDGLCQVQTLTTEFINNNADRFSEEAWSAISRYQKLNIETLEANKDNIDWTAYSGYNELNYRVELQFKDKIDWEAAAAHNKFTISKIKLDEEGNVLHDETSPVINMRTGEPVINKETGSPVYLPQMEHKFQLSLLERNMNKIGITALKANPHIQAAMTGDDGPRISARLTQCFDYELDLKSQLKKNFESAKTTSKDVTGKDIYQEVYQGKHLDKVADILKEMDTRTRAGADYSKEAAELLSNLNNYHLIKRQDGYVDLGQTAQNFLKQDNKLHRETKSVEYYMEKSFEAIKSNQISGEDDYRKKISVLDGVAVSIMMDRKLSDEQIKSAVYSYSPIAKAEMRVAEKGSKYLWNKVQLDPTFDMEKQRELRELVTKKNVDYEKYTTACIEQIKRIKQRNKSMEID